MPQWVRTTASSFLADSRREARKYRTLCLAGVPALAGQPSMLADGGDSGEAVLLCQLRRRYGLPALDAAVSDGVSLPRPQRLSGGIEQRLDGLE
ncbi:hypothetical protein [Bradyrhizobium sp. BWA-3-5]|uniref:hypothetical protein n=1 Tax=Bradyrhizobium sp. BWA-3-5 TaxID=3080013 RepID=UPI00293E5AF4|nr:hypothetical protein [Bradyrhizobium sp. BWA-3-5]WOH70077.1 hypothetical protein RX331_23155 [Bradyrhizobium sp. BWA-3-5]